MEDKNNISIFQGSAVEADTVHDFLAQHEIGSLVRNHMQENLDAGWVTAEPDHAGEVFVAREDQAKAEDLLKNLFHETEKDDASAKPGNPPQQSDKAPLTRQAGVAPEKSKLPPPNAPK